jgi:hypothetical protein
MKGSAEISQSRRGKAGMVSRQEIHGETGLPIDPVIEAYKAGIDRSLIQENLKLSVEERLRNLEAAQRDIETLRRAVKVNRRI